MLHFLIISSIQYLTLSHSGNILEQHDLEHGGSSFCLQYNLRLRSRNAEQKGDTTPQKPYIKPAQQFSVQPKCSPSAQRDGCAKTFTQMCQRCRLALVCERNRENTRRRAHFDRNEFNSVKSYKMNIVQK